MMTTPAEQRELIRKMAELKKAADTLIAQANELVETMKALTAESQKQQKSRKKDDRKG